MKSPRGKHGTTCLLLYLKITPKYHGVEKNNILRLPTQDNMVTKEHWNQNFLDKLLKIYIRVSSSIKWEILMAKPTSQNCQETMISCIENIYLA